MTKSVATDVALTPYSHEAVEAAWAEVERLRQERAPLLEATNTIEAKIREEARRLSTTGEPKLTPSGGEWGGFTACLVSACCLAGQASTAAAQGEAASAMQYIAEAMTYLAKARAML